MNLSDSSFHVRPYAGRDDAFAEAMMRAEQRAVPKPVEPTFVGRTRAGPVKRRNGSFVAPGPNFDRDELVALPILD